MLIKKKISTASESRLGAWLEVSVRSWCAYGNHALSTINSYTFIFLYMKLNLYNGNSTIEYTLPIIIVFLKALNAAVENSISFICCYICFHQILYEYFHLLLNPYSE